MQNPCYNNYFSDTGNNFIGSSNIIRITDFSHGVTDYNVLDNGRPFLPLYGVELDAVLNIYKPVPLSENETYKDSFFKFFEMVFNASKNAVENAVGYPAMYDSPLSNYLYKKIFSVTSMQDRFYNISSLIRNFWENYNVAFTDLQFQQYYINFLNLLNSQVDKNLYIPNAFYRFEGTSDLGVIIAAWKVANPDFAGFYGIELNL